MGPKRKRNTSNGANDDNNLHDEGLDLQAATAATMSPGVHGMGCDQGTFEKDDTYAGVENFPHCAC